MDLFDKLLLVIIDFFGIAEHLANMINYYLNMSHVKAQKKNESRPKIYYLLNNIQYKFFEIFNNAKTALLRI